MFKFLSPLTSMVTGFLGGWQSYLLVAVTALALGSFLGVKVEGWRADSLVSAVQSQYDDYKLAVSKHDLETSEAVVQSINQKNQQIQVLTKQLSQQRIQIQAESESLTKVLNSNEASHDAVHLSPSVIQYLDKLRNSQQTRH